MTNLFDLPADEQKRILDKMRGYRRILDRRYATMASPGTHSGTSKVLALVRIQDIPLTDKTE